MEQLARPVLVAMFVDVDDRRSFPAEEEVAGAGPARHRKTKIEVICHEDEHNEVREYDLYDVK